MSVRCAACLPAAALLVLTTACARESGGAPASSSESQASGSSTATISRFGQGVYAASGVAQLADGRVLVAGDDPRSALAIVDLSGSGAIKAFTRRQITKALGTSGSGELNDLEALTSDPRGHLYASTSHSLTTKGVAKPDREQLVRFDVEGSRLRDMRVSTALKPALIRLDPVFRAASQSTSDEGGLNIEGLAWDPARSRLLIGFRSPRQQGDALVVWLANPDAVFDDHAEPMLQGPVRMNLLGEGIRDLTYSPTLRAFLILAGSWRDRARASRSLWSWRGGADTPVAFQVGGLDDLKPEGVAEVHARGAKALLIVSDDGTADELYDRGRALKNTGVPSRYLLLPLDRLTR